VLVIMSQISYDAILVADSHNRFCNGVTRGVAAEDETQALVGERFRLAVSSCQDSEQGYFSAYPHMADDDVDLVVFVGHYIYESSWSENPVRRRAAPEPTRLVEYRNRYAQYRLDPDRWGRASLLGERSEARCR
jgi:phosphodiesterase/alkaline phosphatase D-like protein